METRGISAVLGTMTTTTTIRKTASAAAEGTQVVGRRQMIAIPEGVHAEYYFATVMRAWNICVQVDRRGRLDDSRHLNQWMGREFGVGLQERLESHLVCRTIQDYKKRRSRANHPLRMKALSRVKTIPVVGPKMKSMVTRALPQGTCLKDVLSARLRRRGTGFVVSIVKEESATINPLLRKLKRLKHRSSAENVGVAVTPDGIDVVVTNQRKNGRSKCYHIAVEHVIAPGFTQEFCRRLVEPRAHTVALDLSMVSQLSSGMQQASRQLRRWFRSRKAAGAIEFGTASPIPGEVQDCLDYAAKVGLKSRRRLLRHEVILACPHCGASIAVKLDPKTLSPAPGVAECVRCGVVSRVGHVLAARASAYVQHDWTEWGSQSPLASDRSAAPHTTTTTTRSNNTKPLGGSARVPRTR